MDSQELRIILQAVVQRLDIMIQQQQELNALLKEIDEENDEEEEENDNGTSKAKKRIKVKEE